MGPLQPGTRIRSAVCETELMVIQAPSGELDLRCGGAPMLAADADPPAGSSLDPDAAEGTLRGKRYVDTAGSLELLCTKPGQGSLACDGERLAVKGAKPLPASD